MVDCSLIGSHDIVSVTTLVVVIRTADSIVTRFIGTESLAAATIEQRIPCDYMNKLKCANETGPIESDMITTTWPTIEALDRLVIAHGTCNPIYVNKLV